jgi:hypothetical protein
MPMLTCVPNGTSSRDYEILEAGSVVASVEPFTFSKKAVFRYRGESFDVIKPTFPGGEWNLSQSSDVIAWAKRPNPFIRSFDLTSDRLYFTLNPSRPMGRTFKITADAKLIGTITPSSASKHPAVIDCAPAMPVLLQLFSFCLVVFMWERGAFDLEIGSGDG